MPSSHQPQAPSLQPSAKPTVIILMHYLELGGAEMALIGLLGALDPAKVDVDLFVHSHQGPLMKFIPEWVNLLPEQKAYSLIERPMTEALRRGEPGLVVRRLLAKWQHRCYLKRTEIKGDDGSLLQFVADAVTPALPPINPEKEYDLCISFLTPHNIGRDKVRARRRWAWIHTDYSTVHFCRERELPVWSAYDRIVSISPNVTKAFLTTFPSLAPKILEMENILSPDFVRRRAAEFDASAEMPGELRLLSIGRYCTAKNYDNVPDIARRMVESGLKGLRWYIIGYGDDSLIRQRIAEAGMEEHVILLGKRENPYPYIKACDVYVQPSRYEGKSVTVREAQMLGRPVAVTAYPTAASQVADGVDGVIVPLDNAGCAVGLADFVRDAALQQKIMKNLAQGDYGNEGEVRKIYNGLEA